ncbi:hypothetical protein [Georgenia yuyongxinii]|uniref:Uncharacterized protein n=1 Tax=Georgenia yuyongxinii TaxID=2589797 RepID=A0A552WR32_9MICO|nr:hypothetical protein [Georgenia yuyongxinii]TRW45261.1 hypothetical protein FJ693_10285 [Georgenia yuyongxinii]
MEAPRSRTGTAVAAATLALAGSAALAFGVGDAIGFKSAGAEAWFIAAWILGWALLVWAMFLGGLGAVLLLRPLASRRIPAWPEVLLLVTGIALIVAVLITHPLWGSGSGSA